MGILSFVLTIFRSRHVPSMRHHLALFQCGPAACLLLLFSLVGFAAAHDDGTTADRPMSAGVVLRKAVVLRGATQPKEPQSLSLKDGHDDDDDDFPTPDACVSLDVFASSDHCDGEVVRTISFPTWSFPNSPCYTDATMKGSSVASQYCNPETGNFHMLLYPDSPDCGQGFWEQIFKMKPLDLTFPTDGCLGGFRLSKCTFKPCQKEDMDGSTTLTDLQLLASRM
jgi:hypothetical protein